jgi:four helix bundle protein
MSVAANYRAACRARSKAEFVAKMGIVREEADEALFWLEMLVASGEMPLGNLKELMAENNELVSIFVASYQTAKSARHCRAAI